MDEAIKFIINVGEADIEYLEGLRKYPDVTLGAAQGPEYLNLPEPLKEIMRRAINEFIYPGISKIINPRVEALREVVINSENVECIHDELMYDLKEYLINAEVPFAVNMIKDTDLKNTVAVPDGIYDKVLQIHNIPLCRKHKPAITQLVKNYLE